MSRVWFAGDLETAATFWRVLRRDGVTLGFTTHDRDLWFDGVLHRASPGMVPAAIRKSADLEPDSAEVRGALTHEAITGEDLAAGRFDGAQVRIGVVDWETRDREVLYAGIIGAIREEDGGFSADLVSRKAELHRDPVPRTSPTCRAAFCGPGCNLNPMRFSREVSLSSVDPATNSVQFAEAIDVDLYVGGTLLWLDGPEASFVSGIVAGNGSGGLVLDRPIDETMQNGTRARLREGCDHTLDTCGERFANAANFRGEPFLPGNDLLTRYPPPAG
ncbi:DUF2163 domain-containing protein [Novosphingobium malaysiense]|uniref:Bacteriophage phiJL001 Gp84 C-terminal domain-containing protein n=1 Tax=Novosphingobium malaysiense TaxID=1348853 RepID=A0A0B1ZTC2_9SPHN|nr:DUF2163 domain-containing protein [Novosphingobium malaysiense]KHK92372.1 hypothetical protein LK12_06045 [Novosphingobium malaysiense]